jgi:PAS domain S-box-containing protein
MFPESPALRVLDGLTDHVCILDCSGRILAVNRTWREFAAANPPAPANADVGGNYFDVCEAATGDDASTARRVLAGLRAICDGRDAELTIEYPCHSPNEKRWFELRATRVREVAPATLLLVHRNVTHRTMGQQALRASDERYRSLVEASLDAVLLTKPDGRIIAANQAACRMFGRTEADLRRVGRAGTVVASDPRLGPALEERNRTGGFRGVLTFIRADGSRFPGEISTAVFIGHADEFLTSMVIRDITEQRQREESLARARDTLRDLSARLEAVREDERRRLSRELHDEFGHALTDIKLDLAAIDRRLHGLNLAALKTPRHRLAAVGKRLDQMATAVRGMATTLRPAILDALGLKAAIEWLARDVGTRATLACSLDLPSDFPALTPDQTTGLFRAVQELLVNVVRHAEASTVAIAVGSAGGTLTISVQDNGRGFDLSTPRPPGALGLVGITERMANLGGHLALDSIPGRGTSASLSIPVHTP